MRSMFDELKKNFVDTLKEKDSQIDELTKRVSKLEERIEEGDSYERRDTLLFSGNKIPPSNSSENTTGIICDLIREKLKINLAPEEISISHRIGNRSASQRADHRPLIAKFCRRDVKVNVLAAARKMKVQDFFVNECLTPVQRTISYVLRKARRQFPEIVAGSTTYDGRNYAWVKPPNPNAPGAKNLKTLVSTRSQLENFCNRTLNKPLTHFVEEWNH